MCGRYTHLFTWKQLHRLMGLTTPVELPFRYNVAPTQSAPVMLSGGGARRLEFFRWGLVPFWAKDPAIGNRTINARSETVATSPSFRAAFKRRRCLVPASGFYEWQKVEGEGHKQPWYITPASEEIFAFAGLWEHWSGKDEHAGEDLHTFTILTTTANRAMAPIHDRMPVILSAGQFDTWLDPAVEDGVVLSPMLAPCAPERLKFARVGTWVNSPRHEDAKCIEPAESGAGEGGLFGPC